MRQVINRKNNSHNFSTGILVFEDGTSFSGNGIGYEGNAVGEVCFNTSITGYQEIITDPSYSDQIINFTFPMLEMLERTQMTMKQIKLGLKELYLIQVLLSLQTTDQLKS